MLKQNGYLENLLVFQNSLISPACYMNWEGFGKLTGFQCSHFVCEGEGGMLVVEGCVGVYSMYLGVLMRFEL